MLNSKECLLISLACVITAIVLIIVGGSVPFTVACLLFAIAGGMHHKSIVEGDLENFSKMIESGDVDFEETAGEIPENVVDLESLSESDREVIQRVFGFDLASGEDYTVMQSFTKETEEETRE